MKRLRVRVRRRRFDRRAPRRRAHRRLDWHWVFLVNLPIGAGVIALSIALLPGAGAAPARPRLDVAGAVAVTAALMLAVYAIVGANDAGWMSPRTLGLLAVAALLLAVFVVIEARVRVPLMPLRLFRRRRSTAANAIGILWAAAMFAWFFLSALYLQLVLGYSPLQVGLAFIPTNVIMAVCSLGISARLVMRFGIKPPLAGGLLCRGCRIAAIRARASRWQFCRRRAAADAAAGFWRRHRVESRADGGNERRCAERNPGSRRAWSTHRS